MKAQPLIEFSVATGSESIGNVAYFASSAMPTGFGAVASVEVVYEFPMVTGVSSWS